MELQQLRARADMLGLNRFVMQAPRKTLIQAIQQAEGSVAALTRRRTGRS
jgi:hypothetical protein